MGKDLLELYKENLKEQCEVLRKKNEALKEVKQCEKIVSLINKFLEITQAKQYELVMIRIIIDIHEEISKLFVPLYKQDELSKEQLSILVHIQADMENALLRYNEVELLELLDKLKKSNLID